MKLHLKLFALTIFLIVVSLLVPYSQAARTTQAVNTSIYLPLITREYPPGLNQIAFLGMDTSMFGDQYIYKIKDDGGELAKLTPNPTQIVFSWSPDGSRITFSAAWTGDDDIYIVDANGHGLVNLTKDPAADEQPAWSHDGSQIAFISDRQGSAQVYKMDANGRNVTRLTNIPLGVANPFWSADGTKIAFNGNSGVPNDDEIYVVKPDGTGLQRLTNNIYYDGVAGWSPTTSQILFYSNRDRGGFSDKQEIYVMNGDGSDQTRLTSLGFVGAATWSPDGSMIAFSNFSDTTDMYTMNSDGSNLFWMKCNSEWPMAPDPSWSPDGTKLAFSIFNGTVADRGIYTVNLNGSNCQHLITMYAKEPEWRPRK